MQNNKNRLFGGVKNNENYTPKRNNPGSYLSSLINSAKNNQIFFYNPDRDLLEKVIISCSALLIKSEKLINKLVIVLSSQTMHNEEYYASRISKMVENDKIVQFVNFSELRSIYSEIIEDADKMRTALMFDDLQNIEDIKTIMRNSHTFKEKFCFVIILTSSPRNYLEIRKTEENIFLPVFYNRHRYHNFFQKTLSASRIVVYNSIENELYMDQNDGEACINSKFATLSRFINDLKMGNISNDMFSGDQESLKTLGVRLMYLLFNGVFDTAFILENIIQDPQYSFIKKHLEYLSHVSDRLDKLKHIIESEEGTDIIIFAKKNGILDIVSSILKYYYPLSKVEKDDKVTRILLYKNDVLYKCITFMDFVLYDSSKVSDDCFIFFDYVQTKIPNKSYILLSQSQEEFLKKQNECEIVLERKESGEITMNSFKSNKPEVEIKLFGSSSISVEALMSSCNDLGFTVRHFNQSDNLLTVEKTNNSSYLGVKLANTIPYAVEIRGLKGYYESFSIVAENVSFGVIASYNTFFDPHSLNMPTFVILRNDAMSLYCMNDTKIYKIKIGNSCIEKYILFDMQEFNINIYICIGKKPKIYEADRNNVRLNKLKTVSKTKDRFDILESITWNRVSLKEVPFIKNRSDIRIEINLWNNPDQQKLREILMNVKTPRGKENYNRNKNQNNTHVKTKLFDIIDSLVYVFNRYNTGKIMFTRMVSEETTKLSISTIYEKFKDEEFSNFYYLVCLLSQKGRFFNYNLDNDDCEIIKMNIKGIVMDLMSKVNTRFLDIKKILEGCKKTVKQETTSQLMRHVIITPLSVIYKFPIAFDGNRVLREFDHEKFLRVSLREEDKNSKVKDSTSKDQNMIYEYYRSILFDGLFIGERKYFFLAMTMSQMRLHSAWFITPYFCGSVLIGPDYVRNWLGDFSEIKNIGKYAMRLGQPLSSTFATLNIEKFKEIPDIKINNHIFSDGIGLISITKAKAISKILGLNHIPSAFQVRFAGFKGVVGVHPLLEEDQALFQGNNFKDVRLKLMSQLEIACEEKEEDSKRKKFESEEYSLMMRPSMKKFLSDHRNVEVVTFASSQPCYLNRQYIMLLEGLGVDLTVFLEHHDDYLFNHLTDIYEKPNDYIKRHFGPFPIDFKIKSSRIYKKLVTTILNKHVSEFYKKNRILVKKGSVLMGTLDELGVLGENEVYIKIRKDLVEKNESFVVENGYYIVTGPVAVMKNPCLHPGDIRTVMAVNRPELGYQKDVLVFNQKGSRPLTNMCSGSDLDGDMYTVIWDPFLLPKESFEPSEYIGSIVLNKEIVSSRDIVNFYIRYIRNYHLGSIAHAHLVYCDEKDTKHENSLLLAELFNRSIDFPKTGFMATVPETLLPRRYPDFMEAKTNVYPSFKTVGILFRRGFDVNLTNSLRCECRVCIEKILKHLPSTVRRILEGSNIYYKELVGDSASDDKSLSIFNSYRKDVCGLVEKYGYKKEEMAFLNLSGDDEVHDEILIDVKRIFNKYKMMINDRKIDCIGLIKYSERCHESINSIPLLLPSSGQHIKTISFRRLKEVKENSFPLNSAIEVKFIKQESMAVDEVLTKKVYSDGLEAFVDEDLYNSFCKMVGQEKGEILKNIFDLLLLGSFFTTKSFDLVCLFFSHFLIKYRQGKKDKLRACRVLQEISREFYSKATTVPFCHFINREIFAEKKKKSGEGIYSVKDNQRNIFNIKQKFKDNPPDIKVIIDNLARNVSTVAALLVLNINFLDKALHITNTKKVRLSMSNLDQQTSRVRIESYSHLIINGMFDSSDELKLEPYSGPKIQAHEATPLYAPKLLNTGYCDNETYKDNLREFFINIFLGGIPPSSNHLGIFFQMIATPGKFYLYNVDALCVNTILTIDQLKAKTMFYKNERKDDPLSSLKSYFYNYSEIFDGTLRGEYIKEKGIVFQKKSFEYILSFFRESVRYQVYFKKEGKQFVVSRISKNKKVKGKAYIIKEYLKDVPKDVHFEISYEEIIYNGVENCFDELEKRIFSGPILSVRNDEYVLDNSLSEFRKFRFEINTIINIKNGLPITLANRQVMTPTRRPLVLDNKHTRLALYSTVTRIFDANKQLKDYIEDFETVWKCFTTYYC